MHTNIHQNKLFFFNLVKLVISLFEIILKFVLHSIKFSNHLHIISNAIQTTTSIVFHAPSMIPSFMILEFYLFA